MLLNQQATETYFEEIELIHKQTFDMIFYSHCDVKKLYIHTNLTAISTHLCTCSAKRNTLNNQEVVNYLMLNIKCLKY